MEKSQRVMWWAGAALLSLGFFVLATASRAADATVIDSVAVFPTYHNLGIQVHYGGDDDSSGTVVGLIQRDGAVSTQWDTLPRFVRLPDWNRGDADDHRLWAASALWCEPGETYNIRIIVSDEDGCTSCDQTVQATTWTERPVLAGDTAGCVFMGPFGSDANAGTRAAPKLTFAGALAALTTGRQIRMLPGTYHAMRIDSLDVSDGSKSGTAASRYTLIADQGPGTVVFTGEDTTYKSPGAWTAKTLQAAPAVTGFVVVGINPPRFPRLITIDDTLRLYPYQTFHDLITDPLAVVDAWGAFTVSDSGRQIYMRLPANMPNLVGRTVRLPMKNAAMSVRSMFWRISGITFKDFGTGFRDVGVSHSVLNFQNQGHIVEDCTFQRLGRPAVGFRRTFAAIDFETHRGMIQGCTFDEGMVSQPWDAIVSNKTGFGTDRIVNAGACADNDSNCVAVNLLHPTILMEVGRGYVIRSNRLRGGADGFVRTGGGAGLDSAQSAHTDIDVYDNVIVNMAGDVMETEAASWLNSRIYRNIILGGQCAVNHSIMRGPMYFCYNTCVNQRAAVLPVGGLNSSIGHAFFVNNTMLSGTDDGGTGAAWTIPQGGQTNQYARNVVVNNIVSSSVGAVWYDGGVQNLNEYNYNKVQAKPGSFSSTNYDGGGIETQTTLVAWRSITGYGANDDVPLESMKSMMLAPHLWDWSPMKDTELTFGARSMAGFNTNNQAHGAPTAPYGFYVGAWPPCGMNSNALFFETCRCRERCP